MTPAQARGASAPAQRALVGAASCALVCVSLVGMCEKREEVLTQGFLFFVFSVSPWRVPLSFLGVACRQAHQQQTLLCFCVLSLLLIYSTATLGCEEEKKGGKKERLDQEEEGRKTRHNG